MDMSATDDSHEMLGQLVGRYIADNFGFEEYRQAISAEGWPSSLWGQFAGELGILGVPFPEALGGLELGGLASMATMEALGRGLAAEPYLSSVIGFGATVRSLDEQSAAALAPIVGTVVSGEARVALALTGPDGDLRTGNRRIERTDNGYRITGSGLALGAAGATHLLVNAAFDEGNTALILFELPVAGSGWLERPLIDGTRAASIDLDLAVGEDSVIATDGATLMEAVHDALLAALASEIVGIVSVLLEMTVDFARQRVQFGKPIAQFQVIQHRLADMHVEAELARSLAWLAAIKQDAPVAERRAVCAAAKARAGQAGRMVAHAAVQIHGGIGTTDELPVSAYLKRLLVIEHLFGRAHTHVDRYAAHRAKLGHRLAVA